MATTQEIYNRKIVSRKEYDGALVVVNSQTPVFTKPTTLQELYAQKKQTRLEPDSATVVLEV